MPQPYGERQEFDLFRLLDPGYTQQLITQLLGRVNKHGLEGKKLRAVEVRQNVSPAAIIMRYDMPEPGAAAADQPLENVTALLAGMSQVLLPRLHNPQWTEAQGQAGRWENYVPAQLINLWPQLSGETRLAVYIMAVQDLQRAGDYGAP